MNANADDNQDDALREEADQARYYPDFKLSESNEDRSRHRVKLDDIDLDSAITLSTAGINRFEDDILANPDVDVETKCLAILVCSSARAWAGYTQLDNRGTE